MDTKKSLLTGMFATDGRPDTEASPTNLLEGDGPYGHRRFEDPPLRPADPRALEPLPRDQRSRAARPPDPDVRPAGQVHRLPQGARDAGPLRGRGLHQLRPRGPDPFDRPLRPV